MGAEPGPAAATGAAAAASISPRWIRPGRSSSTRCRSARSSRSPTATRSTATRCSPTCRSATLLSEAYNAERRRLVGDDGVARAASRVRSPATAGRSCRGASGSTVIAHPETAMDAETEEPRRRTWAAVPGADAWRHVPPRHHRPARQHGLGDAQRRLAVGLAGRAGARLPGVGARPDVLARPAITRTRSRRASGRGRRSRRALALRGGEPYLAFGTPGGDLQDQWALHAFLRHVHHGLNLQEAIDAPSFHSEHLSNSFFPREWRPGHLAVEETFPRATLDRARPPRPRARDRRALVATTTRSRWRRGTAGRCAPAPARAASRAWRSVADRRRAGPTDRFRETRLAVTKGARKCPITCQADNRTSPAAGPGP